MLPIKRLDAPGQPSGGSASAAGTSAGAAAAATAGGPSTALSGPTKQASFAPPDVEEKDKNPLRRLLDRTTVAECAPAAAAATLRLLN